MVDLAFENQTFFFKTQPFFLKVNLFFANESCDSLANFREKKGQVLRHAKKGSFLEW